MIRHTLDMRRALASMPTALLLCVLLGLAACGGSEGGIDAPNTQAVVVTTSTLPPLFSGQEIDYQIPLQGGCGGPYVVEVISGALPRGIGLDDAVVNGVPRHRITGVALEDGQFNFRLQITDTSCVPFASDVVDFSWNITVGQVTIVGAAPGLIAPAEFGGIPALASSPYTDAHAFPVTVYNDLIAYDLVVAGGVGPYRAEVIDDPADPDDGNLPLGLTMPAFSTSITGRPQQVLPGGAPFRLTIEVTDNVGNTTRRKLLFQVDTPALIQGTPTLNDAVAGQVFLQPIQVADGVPPFRYELINNAPTDIAYNAPNAPVVTATPPFTFAVTGEASNRLTNAYPAAADAGPYAPYPSEGLYIVDAGGGVGTMSGIPRRVGSFTMHVHVHSAIVPNERGQHLVATYTQTVSPAAPMAINPVFTNEGVLVAPPEYNSLPEFEVGQAYNPDSTNNPAPGLQLIATGGIPFDGFTDAPHETERAADPQEPLGRYAWSWDPDPMNQGFTPPPGIDLFDGPAGAPYSVGDFGVVNVPALVRQGPQVVRFEVVDNQLPQGVQHTASLMASISVGPDKVIIAEATSSQTSNFVDRHYRNYYDYQTRIRKMQVLGGAASSSDLDGSDLSPTHTVPALTGLASDALDELLSDNNLEIYRAVVNPTGWWNDLPHLNPKGARAMQNSDPNQRYPYYGRYTFYEGENAHPATDLPDCDVVAHAPHLGVYTDGGRMYCFESASHFGVFVIREDASIYVPYAASKSGTYRSFGDGMVQPYNWSNYRTLLRAANFVTSPDGRFGAMKLKRGLPLYDNHREQYTESAMVVFTLTGEKLAAWGNQPYKIITNLGPALADTAPGGSQIAYAPTMSMTNSHLYFVIGNWNGSNYQGFINGESAYEYDHSCWRDHYIMRVQIDDASTAAGLLDSDGANGNWTNTTTTPMQTPCQRWRYYANGGYYYSHTTGTTANTTSTSGMAHEGQYDQNGWGMMNDSMSPMPFRASADGRSMAILAGLRTTSTSGTSVYRHNVWVDVEGSGARQVSSTTVRCPMGGSRGYSLYNGPDWYPHWGLHNGPTTAFEISDDGSKVAVVTHESSWSTLTQYYAYYATTSYNTYPWGGSRNDVRAWATTTDWASEHSSGGEAPVLDTDDYFGGAFHWRMGNLLFTADNGGLIWWAGFSARNPTASNGRKGSSSAYGYQVADQYQGTFYSYNYATNTVRSIVSSGNGGRSAGIGTITSSSPYNPSYTNNTRTVGTIRPVTGFMSRNRNFFYFCTYSGTGSGSLGQTMCVLYGINVSSLTGAPINGHVAGEAFALDNWPIRYGFVNSYQFYSPYGYQSRIGARGGSGQSRQVMAKDTGIVYFQGCYQPYTGSVSTTNPWYIWQAQYFGYGYHQSNVFGFDADVGGAVAHVTNHLNLPTTQNTTYRTGHWLITDRKGSRVAWQFNTYRDLVYRNRERLAVAWGLDWDANNGDLMPGHHAESVEGESRLSDAMAFDSQGKRLFYGRAPGLTAGNENGMSFTDLQFDPDGSTSKDPYTPNRRYSVLWSGR